MLVARPAALDEAAGRAQKFGLETKLGSTWHVVFHANAHNRVRAAPVP